MLRSFLPLLACPDCHSNLVFDSQLAADLVEIERGELICSDCQANYPIERGIPRLMPKNLLAAQRDEIAARDDQVAMYDSNTFLNLFGKVEIPFTLELLNLRHTDNLLEAGCGTGRMTTIFSKHAAQVVSVDFSFESLLVNQTKLSSLGITNVHLIQADICNLPFQRAIFDRAVSCQVLEHVPYDDARHNAIASISRSTKPAATIIISAYQHAPLVTEKEGRHDGGIPFFRFTKQEFHDLLSTTMRVERVTGALVYLYLARCINKG